MRRAGRGRDERDRGPEREPEQPDAVDALAERLPDDRPLPEFALRWILDHDAVSTVIPGSTTPAHIESNAAASEAASLSDAEREAASAVYDEFVREHVHHRW